MNKGMPNYAYIRKELLRNGVSKKILWSKYCEDCRIAGEEPLMYSQFCYYIQKDEEKRRATMHIHRKSGEQVEWTGLVMRYTSLTRIPVKSQKPGSS